MSDRRRSRRPVPLSEEIRDGNRDVGRGYNDCARAVNGESFGVDLVDRFATHVHDLLIQVNEPHLRNGPTCIRPQLVARVVRPARAALRTLVGGCDAVSGHRTDRPRRAGLSAAETVAAGAQMNIAGLPPSVRAGEA